ALAGYLQSSSYRLTRFEQNENEGRMVAKLAAVDAEHKPKVVAALVKALRPNVDQLAKELTEKAGELQAELGVLECDLRGARIVVDYENLRPGEWMTDGPTFGIGPIRT